jgi:hypothetical protein
MKILINKWINLKINIDKLLIIKKIRLQETIKRWILKFWKINKTIFNHKNYMKNFLKQIRQIEWLNWILKILIHNYLSLNLKMHKKLKTKKMKINKNKVDS